MQDSVTNKELNLEIKKIAPLVWEYSIPAIIGTLVNTLYNIVDRIFIGQGVGALAISGLAISFPVTILASTVCWLVLVSQTAFPLVWAKETYRRTNPG